jgi:hypothetical protein
VYLPKVKPAVKFEPLEGPEPKLKVAVLLPKLVVVSGFDFWLSVAPSSAELAALLQMRPLKQQNRRCYTLVTTFEMYKGKSCLHQQHWFDCF